MSNLPRPEQFYVLFEEDVPVDHFKWVFSDGKYIKLDSIGGTPIVWNEYNETYESFTDYPSALRAFADLLERLSKQKTG